MLEDRNQTSHAYDEMLARKIYKNITHYFPELEKGCKFLKEKAGKIT